MSIWPRSLSLRLSLLFASISTLVLGGIGFYLYLSLHKEIAWRDDQALLGRLERMHALLDDSASIAALRERPQLYGNMLGNRQSLLWILDADGHTLIEINPVEMSIPHLPATETIRFTQLDGDMPARLAWLNVSQGERSVTLVAGKLLDERNQMLSAYRFKLAIALAVGAVLAFILGWLASQRGLRPVRHLASRAARIDTQHLHLRLEEQQQVSELHALTVALNLMLARLENGFSQLSRFCEDLAHEMRTPLSNLMGQTQHTLSRPRTRNEYESLLVSNQEEYERLARMIDNMLFLARTEQPKTSLTVERLSVSDLVEQLSEYFEGMAEDRDLHLVNETIHEVHADRDLLRRALANLIANALRYAASGSSIVISSHACEDCVEIRVHNQGPAINAEHLPHLFERFYRCDPSRTEAGDSGGLGLAIVRSITLLHGGSVDVQSDDTGTCFIISLPH
ncbi:heavy metal sensor histidine kinase [Marinobacterium sp. MBR-109]|jgi:two-component system heavy metal sensor histidine kinase CusS|uniref:heavy metal sensor histidine kinase n=1 Tax=Marinobacterium sp. MBR-109 TaxID=3156462 RepID=UPI0033942A34